MNEGNFSKNRYESLWIVLFVVEIIALTWCAMSCEGVLENFLNAMAYWTARVSLIFFGAYFLHTSTCKPYIYELRQRDELFALLLIFAIAHSIHGVFLWANILFGGLFQVKILNLLAGTAAYALILSAPFLWKRNSDNESFRKYLFTYFSYYIWLIFLMTYMSRLTDTSRLDKTMYYFWGMLTLALGVLGTWYRVRANRDRSH